MFQSTPFREGRQRRKRRPTSNGCFNPRPFARGDRASGAAGAVYGVSIHALSRGATIADAARGEQLKVSIHALSRGATDASGFVQVDDAVSIHALSRGATPAAVTVSLRDAVSIHALSRGATPKVYNIIVPREGFNPRPFARGDSKWFLISFGNSGIHPLFCYIR